MIRSQHSTSPTAVQGREGERKGGGGNESRDTYILNLGQEL